MRGVASVVRSATTLKSVGVQGETRKMMYVNTQPETLAAAAADVAGVGSTISAASDAAAGLTTGVPAAAADEVSTATAMLFNVYAQEYQAAIAQAVTFHDKFARALAAAGNAYANTEAANEVAVSGVLGALTTSSGPLSAHPLTVSTVTGATVAPIMKSALVDPDVTLVMGGSGTPIPSPSYVASVVNTYVTPTSPVSPSPTRKVYSLPKGSIRTPLSRT